MRNAFEIVVSKMLAIYSGVNVLMSDAPPICTDCNSDEHVKVFTAYACVVCKYMICVCLYSTGLIIFHRLEGTPLSLPDHHESINSGVAK